MLYHVNNVFNFQVNNLSSNSALDFGHTIVRGQSVNQQQVGGQNTVGPAVNTIRTDFALNVVKDPDLLDQPQRGIN